MDHVKKASLNVKKSVLLGTMALLTAAAALFASAPCIGIFYEPKVPHKFLEKG